MYKQLKKPSRKVIPSPSSVNDVSGRITQLVVKSGESDDDWGPVIKRFEGEEYATLTNPRYFLKSLGKHILENEPRKKQCIFRHSVDGRPKLDYASTIYTIQPITNKELKSQSISNIFTLCMNNLKEGESFKNANELYSFPKLLYQQKSIRIDDKTINIKHIVSPDMGAIYKLKKFDNEMKKDNFIGNKTVNLFIGLYSLLKNIKKVKINIFKNEEFSLKSKLKEPVSLNEKLPTINQVFSAFGVDDDEDKSILMENIFFLDENSVSLICPWCYNNRISKIVSIFYPDLICFKWKRKFFNTFS
jgi:hypothetical protein